MRVEIWSDVVCPWCYIGKRRFEKAKARFEADHDPLDVVYKPFMLDPTASAVPSPVRAAYEKKFGGPEAANQVIERVSAEAAKEGLEFRFDLAQRANTLSAHRLLVLAENARLQEPLKERMMKAYFTEGLNIADPEVLVVLAHEVGMDAEAARTWLDQNGGASEVSESLLFAADNAISSVPTFVIDRRLALPGAQDPDTILRVLTRLAEREGPDILG